MELAETNRKINIYIISTLILLIFIISVVLLVVYFSKNELEYLTYSEDGKVKYEVLLEENEYFEDKALEENNQYIAALIDKINADFKYNMKLNDYLEYSYIYRITADVEVVEKDTNKPLYELSEILVDEVSGEGNSSLWIDEDVSIDYKRYNTLISEFIKVYNLKNTDSKLTLNLYVGVSGENLEVKNYSEPVIAMNVPLTTNTIAIDVAYKVKNGDDASILLGPKYENISVWLKVAVGMFIGDGCLLIGLIVYISLTATDEEKYKAQLKKIVNNYGSYISRVEDSLDMEGYQVLKVSNFVDLLEIRDTIHIPIIMIENKEQLVTYFAILSNNIIYFYTLGVEQYVLAAGKGNDTYEEFEEFGDSTGASETFEDMKITDEVADEVVDEAEDEAVDGVVEEKKNDESVDATEELEMDDENLRDEDEIKE